MGNAKKDNRSVAREFLRSHRTATVATVGSRLLPDAASVFYIVDDKLNLYFMTRVESRKFKNIQKKPKVSVVVTDEKQMKTIQISGKAKPLDEMEEGNVINKLWAVDYKSRHWPGPAVRLFESGHTTQLAAVKVTPKEMTYAHFQQIDDGRYRPFFETII